jgi:GPI mannosyltransferase 4
MTDIPFLCCISSLILLSSRPHQEFRFLLPIIPLLLTSLSRFLPFYLFLSDSRDAKSRLRSDRKAPDPLKKELYPKVTSRYYVWCAFWILFNLLAGIFMGSLHQSAIVPSAQYLSNRIRQSPPPPVCLHPENSESVRQTRMIWHRTYPAPDWLFAQPLDDSQTSIEIFNLGGKWDRLWELLNESGKVPLNEAQLEIHDHASCDSWFIANNGTLQR